MKPVEHPDDLELDHGAAAWLSELDVYNGHRLVLIKRLLEPGVGVFRIGPLAARSLSEDSFLETKTATQ